MAQFLRYVNQNGIFEYVALASIDAITALTNGEKESVSLITVRRNDGLSLVATGLPYEVLHGDIIIRGGGNS